MHLRARGGCWPCDSSWGQWRRKAQAQGAGHLSHLCQGLRAAGCRRPWLTAVDALGVQRVTIGPPGQQYPHQQHGWPWCPSIWKPGPVILSPGRWAGEDSPLHRMARLRPRASAVPELMFSTRRCFTFFSTGSRAERASVTEPVQLGCWPAPAPAHLLVISDLRQGLRGLH